MRYTNLTILFTLFMLFMWMPNALHAQKNKIDRTPADSLKCLELFSVYSLALEKKMFDYAIGPWRYMLENCPDASTRIYSDGVELLTHYIEVEKDENNRQALIDTVLIIYDRRIEWFGDHERYPEGWILGRKGLEIVKYRRDEPKALQLAYDCFEKSYKLLKKDAELPVMLAWMQTTRSLYARELIPADSLLDNFVRINSHLAEKLESTSSDDKKAVYQKVLSAVDNIFRHSGISDCNLLVNHLEKINPIAKMDPGAIKRNINLMEIAGCIESDYYLALIEKNYKNAPESEAAMKLARMFVKLSNYEDARIYYLESLENGQEDTLKAICAYELAVLLNGHFGEVENARQFARRASTLNPHWGAPYMLLGSIYAREAANLAGDEFEKQTGYWAAVDQFALAMKVDSTFSEEAKKQIAIYSQYFPDQQTCFFQGIEEGQTFKVKGWINENTVVRCRE